MGLFYIVRAFVITFGGKFPNLNNYLFNDPGFPSIFISYLKSNDLYFSGHIGLLTMCLFLSIREKLSPGITLMLGISFLNTLFSLIFLGAHYTNDIIIGIIAGYLI